MLKTAVKNRAALNVHVTFENDMTRCLNVVGCITELKNIKQMYDKG